MGYKNLIHSVIFVALIAIVTAQNTFGNETDKLALLAIKAGITYDPSQIMDTWNNSVHFCRWKGVTCGRKHERVIELDLWNLGLRGQISPSISNLSFLGAIYLNENSFRGEIPPDIGRLKRLWMLDFGSNFISGQIPKNLSLCSKLRFFRMEQNNLNGEIPSMLGSMPNLMEFFARGNQLEGKIPPQLGNLTRLSIFDVGENSLEGKIPEELGRLTNLFLLTLSSNKLSGTIPKSIFNHSRLGVFIAPDNKLEGELPREIGLTLPSLKWFVVVRNQLYGKIPVSFGNASNLEVLEISNNKFYGGVPEMFQNLIYLKSLYMSETDLGSGGADDDFGFIKSLANCSDLNGLNFMGSNFGGKFPVSIFNLSTKLESLKMSNNRVSGEILEGIGNLIGLNTFMASNNSLSGTIPTSFGNLKKLKRLSLRRNKFSGEIPSSLGNLTSLLSLDLQKNRLQGILPSSLGNCKSLERLDISSNSLEGDIPKVVFELSLLTILLDLSRNNFSGSLPSTINLKNLEHLDVSFNQLSGVIPSSIGECTKMRLLFMSHNMFNGAIPESLSLLPNIETIDLSHNKLSGEIPSKIARLAFLSNLNLSFNDLEGKLPEGGIFENATAVSIAGNQKLCGGISQMGLKACIEKTKSVNKSLFHSTKGKLIISLVFAFLVLPFLLYLIFSWWFKKRGKNPQVKNSTGNSFMSVSYGELLKATEGFASENLIGEGSIGSVYKGVLGEEQTLVAVKVFNLEKRGASKSFASECETLRGVRHRNLVKIITACSSIDYQGNEFKALVYELMPNGNLDSLLHSNQGLDLSKRIDIAIDVASAVDYLHNNVEAPIVHCDIKPSNVLLDRDYNACLGDFGLSRVIPHENEEISNNQTSSSGLKGTIGYASPEYGMGSKVSKEGDMYSFGILLLELLTGKRPTDSDFGDGMNLCQFVKTALPERVTEILEQGIIPTEENDSTSNGVEGQTKKTKILECCVCVLQIGVICSDEFPRARMKIDEALKQLLLAKKQLL